MHRLVRPLCLAAILASFSTAFAGGADSIAIYAGTEKITSVGGGNSTSGEGSSSGKRRQPVFIAVDINTGHVQKVRLNTRTKRYVVEEAVQYNQVIPRTDHRRPREYVRLMLVKHTPDDPQPGTFTDTASYYDGRAVESVIDSAGLTGAYPRVLKWTFALQYSGFQVAPPAVEYYPQIDTGTALLSLNKKLTRNAVGKPLADAVNIIIGALADRRYQPDGM